MKVGIYIDGLGQSVAQETVVKYATRIKNVLSFHKTGVHYDIKVEKIKYTNERDSNVVSIVKKEDGNETIIYKMYEFRYGEILTEDFKKRNVLLKNFYLFSVVISKLPILFKRIFVSNGYNRPGQTIYLFLIFLVFAFAILFMIPATLGVITDFANQKKVIDFVHTHGDIHRISTYFNITRDNLKRFAEMFVSIIAIILLLVPGANLVVTNLATEFVCAHLYLQFGQQKQDILGNIDQLFEYIAENEKDSKIHIHSYSFGTLVAMDYLFSTSKKPTGNVLERTEALITIGTPFDFINSYYPNYYLNRYTEIKEELLWINIYSIADALGSNFRNDSKAGEAEYGINKDAVKPENVSYEIVILNDYNPVNFILLTSLKVHGMYWSSNTNGQSCIDLLYSKMREKEII